MIVKGTLKVADWNEVEVKGDLFRVSAAFDAMGGLTGRVGVEYLMYTYRHADDSRKSETAYRGFLTFDGVIGELEGTFVLADGGLYSEKGPESRFFVVENTGTGGFVGVTGYGKYFPQGDKLSVEMDIEIEGYYD